MSKESRKKSSEPAGSAKPAGVAKPAGAAKPARPAKVAARTSAKAKPSAKPSVAFSRPAAKPARRPTAATRSAASSKASPVPPQRRPTGPNEGDKAPGFTLPRDGGKTVSLSDFAGQNLVLFFYPKANTPGCTREAIDFSRLQEDFVTGGTTVLGVSADSIKAQDSFRDKHELTVPLLSDATHEMLEAYGAWGEKTLYGRKFLGIIRSTILIGRDGRIARIWRNVKVDGHADAVLAAVQSIQHSADA